jgi:hypothetical protein
VIIGDELTVVKATGAPGRPCRASKEPEVDFAGKGDPVKRLVCIGFAALVFAVALHAQEPKGWLARIDRSTSASDPDASGIVRLAVSGAGMHATTPQAAVFWNPDNVASGVYTLKGTFTLLKPSSHTNYYGLVFGGSDLGGAREAYLYFMVAQDGSWLLKSRDGNATRDLAGRTIHPAVKRLDASGRSVNALEVRVQAAKIDYVVNGTVVGSTPRTGRTAKTDGLWGFRSNHLLDVQVDGLTVTK